MSSEPHAPNRREMLRRSLGAAVAGAGLLHATSRESVAAPTTQRAGTAKPFRIAHITDAHVHPGRGAPEGLRKCLSHARHQYIPDLIVAGGDQIRDALAQPAEQVQTYFDCWHAAVRETCPDIPIAYVIGNHDIWGWADPTKSGTTGQEPRYGKAWAMESFGLAKPYYSLDRGGWRIIVLDSCQYDGGGAYVAQLGDEQFAWLKSELARTEPTMPVVIFSHVPIFGICPFLFDEHSPTTQSRFPKPRWGISRALMHVDARELKDLFKQHPNVKLCVSGHIHMADHVEYLGVTYISNPAVSASWWTGPLQEFENGYAVIDLFADGTFAHQNVYYGWTART